MLRRWRKRPGLLFDLLKNEKQFFRHFPLGFLGSRLREDEKQIFVLGDTHIIVELSALLEVFLPWRLSQCTL